MQSGRKRSIDNTQPSVDYSTTPVKPPYSYAQLITLAFHAQPEKMLTLTEIYNYIRQQFAYYRQSGDGWQNSIRCGRLYAMEKCHIFNAGTISH